MVTVEVVVRVIRKEEKRQIAALQYIFLPMETG